MPITARLFAATIDCSDPALLAAFYKAFLGGEIRSFNADFAVLTTSSDVRLDFQRVANPHPLPWPDPTTPRRVHLDFSVEDLDQATEELLRLGATLTEHQPAPHRFRVFHDPEGHVFCLASTTAAQLP